MSNWKQIEATMERTGSDKAMCGMYGDVDEAGFSLRSAFRRVGRGISRGARGLARGVARGASFAKNLPRSAWKSVSSFIPGRDRGKAAIVKRLNAKLVKERANFLQIQDLRRGISKPRAAYLAKAKPWSRFQIKKVGLPVKLAGNGASTRTASAILGDDVIGDWWNPLSWFSEKEEEATANTEQERAPDSEVQQVQQEMAPPVEEPIPDAPPEEAAGDWSTFSKTFTEAKKAGEATFMPTPADDAQGDFVGKLYRSIKDPLADMDGDRLVVDGDGNIVRTSEINGAFVGADDLFGAAEERAIDASGDADFGRRFHRRKHRGGFDPLGRFRGGNRGFGDAVMRAMKKRSHHQHNPVAHALKLRIKAQLAASKVVSKALVKKWAAAKAGIDSGETYRSFFRKMKLAINARGGTVSRDKSETAGCRR